MRQKGEKCKNQRSASHQRNVSEIKTGNLRHSLPPHEVRPTQEGHLGALQGAFHGVRSGP